jgi:hypothetical protein
MGGEELPYPGLSYVLGATVFSTRRELTPEDVAILRDVHTRMRSNSEYALADSMDLVVMHARTSYALADSMDLVVMHARTSCPGVKPAMKNLAVFLKYS